MTTATAARPVTSSAAHWYFPKTGTPCHTVPRADGQGTRPTTLADARKLNLLPSVTTILKVCHKEGLQNWLVEQACLAVLTAPREAGEALDAFVARVLQEERHQDQEAQIARDRGTEIHQAMSDYFNGQEISAEICPWVMPAIEAIKGYGNVVATERVLVGDGYAGTVDLMQEMKMERSNTLWDYKATRNLPDPKKGAWPEHKLQLSAYAGALWNTSTPVFNFRNQSQIITANLYISTETPGQFAVCKHEDWRGTYERGFRPLLQFWQWSNNYYPAV